MEENLTIEDFNKAVEALRKANVEGPITIIANTKNWTAKHWELYYLIKDEL